MAVGIVTRENMSETEVIYDEADCWLNRVMNFMACPAKRLVYLDTARSTTSCIISLHSDPAWCLIEIIRLESGAFLNIFFSSHSFCAYVLVLSPLPKA